MSYEESISGRLPETWDFIDTNVLYSFPVQSDQLPRGVVRDSNSSGRCKGPLGEKDVAMFNPGEEVVGYIEVKRGGSNRSKRYLEDKAEEQMERANEYWNARDYGFVGGLATDGSSVRPWDGRGFEDSSLKVEQFGTDTVDVVEDGSLELRSFSENGLARELLEIGWDEAYSDVIYGMPVEGSVPRGLAGTNGSNGHIGQMDIVAYRRHDDGEIIGHIERDDKDIETIEKRLDSSREFWKGQGYEFQGGLYNGEEFIPRDFDEDEWRDY